MFVARRDGTTVKRVIDADAPAVYTTPGHLLFVRETTLFAQPFDLDRLDVSGPAGPLAESIAQNRGVSLSTLSASPTGHRRLRSLCRTVLAVCLVRSKRQASRLGRAQQCRRQSQPAPRRQGDRLESCDGRRVGYLDHAVERGGLLTRVTSDPDSTSRRCGRPTDGTWCSSPRAEGLPRSREAVSRWVRTRAGDPAVAEGKNPTDISRDGRVLLYDAGSSTTATDVFALSLTGDPDPHPVVQTRAVEREGQFSPDGKWLAYSSNETSRTEVYVQPYPGPGPRVPISTGGRQPAAMEPHRRGYLLYRSERLHECRHAERHLAQDDSSRQADSLVPDAVHIRHAGSACRIRRVRGWPAVPG